MTVIRRSIGDKLILPIPRYQHVMTFVGYVLLQVIIMEETSYSKLNIMSLAENTQTQQYPPTIWHQLARSNVIIE